MDDWRKVADRLNAAIAYFKNHPEDAKEGQLYDLETSLEEITRNRSLWKPREN